MRATLDRGRCNNVANLFFRYYICVRVLAHYRTNIPHPTPELRLCQVIKRDKVQRAGCESKEAVLLFCGGSQALRRLFYSPISVCTPWWLLFFLYLFFPSVYRDVFASKYSHVLGDREAVCRVILVFEFLVDVKCFKRKRYP